MHQTPVPQGHQSPAGHRVLKKPVRLILIRHGETDWTRACRYQGHTDIPLNATGKKQAARLGRCVGDWKLDALYTSPLLRAHHTAQAIARAAKVKIQKDDRLKEICFGTWEGKTAQELTQARDRVFLAWCKGKWPQAPGGGESLSKFQKRTQHFLRDLRAGHAGENVAVVSHGGWIRMLIVLATGLPLRHYGGLQIHPASVSMLDVFDDGATIVTLNDVCHI